MALPLEARLIGVGLLLLALAGAVLWIRHDGASACRADAADLASKQAAAIAESAQEARRLEQARAAKVQEVQDEKDRELRDVNSRLSDALVRLQHRADRPADMPEAGRAACAGATGAELSRPDAEFLEREAAQADTLRAELAACQSRERANAMTNGAANPR